MPGISLQTVTFDATSTGIGLAEDMGKGLVGWFRSLPMARSPALAGRTTSDLTRNVFVIVLRVVMGVLIGFRMHVGVVPSLGGLLVLLMFSFALSWVFAVIGLSVRNAESAQAVAFPLTLPPVFASSAFVQMSTMRGWIQAFAKHQPVTAAADATRRCMLGGSTTSLVLQSLAWSIGIVVVFTPLTIARYCRVV